MGFAQKVEIPPTAVGGWFRSFLQNRCIKNSKIPPTAVGGWFKSDLFMRVTPALKLQKVGVREGLKVG